MPNYTFYNTETDEYVTLTMSMLERDNFIKENIHMKQVIHSPPAIGDPIRLGLKKPDSSFRDLLKEIKKRHSRGITKSTINTY